MVALEEELARLLGDRESGASEIEGRLAALLLAAPDADLSEAVRSLPGRLAATFPQMANLADLAEELEAAVPAGPAALRERLVRRRDARRSAIGAIADALERRLPAGDLLVFTLSKSGTVTGVLLDLARRGRRLNALVAESRPGGEGARLARELGEHGIRSRVCDDLLLLSLVPPDAAVRRPPGYTGSTVVIVGTDAIHPDALVNKVGTRALLDIARASGVPAFVLGTAAKVRRDPAPKALGSLFEPIPAAGLDVLTEEAAAFGESSGAPVDSVRTGH